MLKTSVPYVSRVENRVPAVGGAEAERVEDAKVRGPLLLRSRGRAVTAEDFETLARAVAPDAARVQCVPAGSGADNHGVRVLVVPHVFSDELGRVRRGDLDPPDEVLERISTHLGERRLVGSRVLVEPADYVGLTAVVSVTSRPTHRPDDVRSQRPARAVPLVPPAARWPRGHRLAVRAHGAGAPALAHACPGSWRRHRRSHVHRAVRGRPGHRATHARTRAGAAPQRARLQLRAPGPGRRHEGHRRRPRHAAPARGHAAGPSSSTTT